jgi:hypothetical protein
VDIEPGMIVIGIAILIFYLRILQLRGRRKKLERKLMVARMSNKSKNKSNKSLPLENDKNAPPYKVTSWVLVIIGVILMLAGIAYRTMNLQPQLIQDFWWVPTTIGVLVFVFCFKVDVPER